MKYYGLNEKQIEELKKRRCLTAYIEEVKRYCKTKNVENIKDWIGLKRDISDFKQFIFSSFSLSESKRGYEYWMSKINQKQNKMKKIFYKTEQKKSY